MLGNEKCLDLFHFRNVQNSLTLKYLGFSDRVHFRVTVIVGEHFQSQLNIILTIVLRLCAENLINFCFIMIC